MVTACTDPEGGGDRGSGPSPPLENDKNIGFLSNTGPDPLKNHSYLARIQRRVNINTPAARWWPANSSI